jgi:hypothetical protein
MRFRLAALLLGLAAALGSPEPTRAQTPGAAAHGWCYAGSYSCYASACAKAQQLRNHGYCAKVVPSGGYYAVYYRH